MLGMISTGQISIFHLCRRCHLSCDTVPTVATDKPRERAIEEAFMAVCLSVFASRLSHRQPGTFFISPPSSHHLPLSVKVTFKLSKALLRAERDGTSEGRFGRPLEPVQRLLLLL